MLLATVLGLLAALVRTVIRRRRSSGAPAARVNRSTVVVTALGVVTIVCATLLLSHPALRDVTVAGIPLGWAVGFGCCIVLTLVLVRWPLRRRRASVEDELRSTEAGSSLHDARNGR